MTWYDNEIANRMGYSYCVLFDCARDAISAYHDLRPDKPLGLPENVCPELVSHMRDNCPLAMVFGSINQETGLSNGAVHLYGYQAPPNPECQAELSVDPLMTGWVRHLKTESAVVSFGKKKMLSIGYGGALLTQDKSLADDLEYHHGHWNEAYTDPLKGALELFCDRLEERWEIVDCWDQYLGDSLFRIPKEQLMPWRVMRRAHDALERNCIVEELRFAGCPVGTNYQPIQGRNQWGDTVLNFPCLPTTEKGEIQKVCGIVNRVVADIQGRYHHD